MNNLRKYLSAVAQWKREVERFEAWVQSEKMKPEEKRDPVVENFAERMLRVSRLLRSCFAVVAILAAAGPVAAEPPTRVDLFARDGKRLGYLEVDPRGRIDIFDAKARRQGYGTIDASGRVDTYDTKSRRTDPSRVVPGLDSGGKRGR